MICNYEGSVIDLVSYVPQPVGCYTSQEATSFVDGTTALSNTSRPLLWKTPSVCGIVLSGTKLQGGVLVPDIHAFTVTKSGRFEVSCDISLLLGVSGGERLVSLSLVNKENFDTLGLHASSIVARAQSNIERITTDDSYACVRLFSVVYLKKDKSYQFVLHSESDGEGELVSPSATNSAAQMANCSGCYVTYFSD